MDLTIRQATLEDYEALCALLAQVDTLHGQALPHVFRAPGGPSRSREFIASIITNEHAALLVAEHDGQIVGCIDVIIQQAPDIPIMVPRRFAKIDTLVVAEGFRCAGIGRALLERAQQWAADRQATQVELNVWEFNQAAIAFYEKQGYETAQRRMWRSLRE
ncbi:MAG: GNAT family N-acetyltransferase [Chloroflexi bacterium]|nr:GNAT family N-acetyltransferase [Chloroflexota bacterium]MBU1751741.1 GNAT family N-acetyltransferase [Chloroflexota bacterium]MBU1879208.1 GNAT family N-acetyltransferase [Chloroflexota bacterium]